MAKETDDTGWRAPEIIESANGPTGVIQMATGLEATPCCMCKQWHKDTRKLEQFIRKRGLTPDAEGRYEFRTPDLPNRESIKIKLEDWGFCLTLGMPTHMNAGKGCEYWKPDETRADLMKKIKR